MNWDPDQLGSMNIRWNPFIFYRLNLTSLCELVSITSLCSKKVAIFRNSIKTGFLLQFIYAQIDRLLLIPWTVTTNDKITILNRKQVNNKYLPLLNNWKSGYNINWAKMRQP